MGQSNLKNGVALFALATLTGLGMAQTALADPTTKWNGAPETREDDRRFHVSGRFMYDIAYTDADYSSAAGAAFTPGWRSYSRRAFIGVDGRLSEHWRYNAKFDLGFGTDGASGANDASVKADDFYLEYADDWGSIFIGNNNAIAPMEDRMSSLNTPFNERSFIVTASGVGKRPGVAFLTNGGNWSAGVALQSNDELNTKDTAANGSEPYFVAARGTWAPIYQQTPEGTTVLHLGVYGRYRNNGDGNANTLNGPIGGYSPSALSNKASNNAGVGSFTDDTFWLAEAAFQWNAFGVAAEYGQFETTDSPFNTTQTDDASGSGYHVDLFWSPTGESRNYKAADGSFGSVAPNRPMGSGGIGHVMLSARYESIDLTDDGFANGSSSSDRRNETTAYTVGATWVPIDHVKFQLNYSSTDVDYVIDNAAHLDNTIDAITFRTQFDW